MDGRSQDENEREQSNARNKGRLSKKAMRRGNAFLRAVGRTRKIQTPWVQGKKGRKSVKNDGREKEPGRILHLIRRESRADVVLQTHQMVWVFVEVAWNSERIKRSSLNSVSGSDAFLKRAA